MGVRGQQRHDRDDPAVRENAPQALSIVSTRTFPNKAGISQRERGGGGGGRGLLGVSNFFAIIVVIIWAPGRRFVSHIAQTRQLTSTKKKKLKKKQYHFSTAAVSSNAARTIRKIRLI